MLDSFLEPLKMKSGAGKTPIWWKRFFNLVGPTTKQTWIPLVVYLGNGIGNGKVPEGLALPSARRITSLMEKVNVKMRDMIDYCDVLILCLLNPQYDCGYFY